LPVRVVRHVYVVRVVRYRDLILSLLIISFVRVDNAMSTVIRQRCIDSQLLAVYSTATHCYFLCYCVSGTFLVLLRIGHLNPRHSARVRTPPCACDAGACAVGWIQIHYCNGLVVVLYAFAWCLLLLAVNSTARHNASLLCEVWSERTLPSSAKHS
jgi:hypothetical protein